MPADPDTPQTDARTLFVRNVAFDVDAAQLEEVFTEIGPVRQCFLVTDKQQQAAAAAVPQKRHKGIAFVQFAIPEDAERALDELNGKEVAGRRLKIERAHKRATFEERKQKKRQAADEGADQDADEQQHQQQQQPGSKAKKPAAAAAAGEQPPPKRHKTAQQQQQQQGAPAGTPSDKHKWLRTVALGVQSPGVYLHAAQQLAAACGGLVEVLDPAPADVVSKAHLTQDGCSGHVVFLVYENVKAASHAVTQLHGQQLTPATLAAAAAGSAKSKDKRHKKLGMKEAKRLAKQQQQQQEQEAAAAAAAAAVAAAADGDGAAVVTLWARVLSGEGAHVKKWRIILRNLAFQATEPELRKLLSSSGAFVWDLQLPRGADGRVRGFAFASFTSHPEAEKAIKAVNGQMLRKRPVAADWAIAKVQYEGLKGQQQQQQQPEPAAGSSYDGSDGGSSDKDIGSDGGSGSDNESEGGESQGGESEEGSEVGSGLSDTDEQESEDEIGMESDESEEDDDVSGSEDDVSGSEDDVMDSSSEEEGEQEDADVRAERDALASALDAVLKQQQQQQQANGAAGNKAPQQQQQQGKQQQEAAAAATAGAAANAAGGSGAVSRTVFVRGLPLDTTSIELQARFDRFGPVKACRIVVDKTTGKPKGTAFIEFKSPEPAAAAAAASACARAGKGPDVTVKGVSLTVDLALTQDDARRLGVEHGRGSAGAAGGPQGSVGLGGKFDRRNLFLSKEGFIEEGSAVWASMSENDRRKRKRAAEEKNQKLKSPNFAVSTTRLAVRNIPVSWDEKKLKAVFIAGVKERATKENPKVVQVKILRDAERPDPSGNPGGRSRGFGFVEFADHSHALAALRQLNNNPKTFGSTERRPIVEFACDNVKVLKMRQDKLQMQKQQRQARKEQQQQQQGGDEEGGQEGDEEVGEDGSEGGEGSDYEEAAEGDAPPGAAAAGGQKGKGPGRKGDKQQQQQQQEGGEKLTKRQLKRRKDKERRQAKWQQQKQQQNGVALAAGPAGAGAAKKPPQQQQQQRGKKGGAATAAAATAAAAQAARLAAKSARQQQQVAAEEAVRGQKRRADDYLDRLASLDDPGAQGSRQQQQQQQGGAKQKGPAAAAAGGDGGNAKKRHKPGRAAEERLEKLVDDYKSKLFGLGGSSSGVQQSQQQQKRSLSRWFE